MKTKIISLIVFILSFSLVFFAVQYFFKRDASLDAELKKVSNTINKACPIQLDAKTRLDSTTVVSEKMLQYNYTLNIDKREVNLDELANYIKTKAQNNLDTGSEMQLYRDNNITLRYNYNDNDGNFLLHFEIKHKK